MTAIDYDAELLRLARFLRVEPERLDYLVTVSPASIRNLLQAMEDDVLQRNARDLLRVSATAKVLPTALVARITERTGSALLTARLAAVLPPARAVEVAKRLSPTYLSIVAAHSSGRQLESILAGLPRRTVEEVCLRLVVVGDRLTLGAVLSRVPAEEVDPLMRLLGDVSVAGALPLADLDSRERLRAVWASRR